MDRARPDWGKCSAKARGVKCGPSHPICDDFGDQSGRDLEGELPVGEPEVGSFLRICTNFSTSATTLPDRSLTSILKRRSIFSWELRACLISPICSSDSRKVVETVPRPGFRKRILAAL